MNHRGGCDPGWIDTLAAAYAEAGDWENAIRRQDQAIEMGTKDRDRQEWRDRLELYKQHKPYRQPNPLK